MKAITCPQCGSLIRNILPRQPIAECEYCGAKIIAAEQSLMPEPFDEEAAKFRALAALPTPPRPPVQSIFIAIAFIGVFFVVAFIISFIPTRSHTSAQVMPTPIKLPEIPWNPPPLMTNDNDDAALKFGGNGTSAGLFDGASAIAVSKNGDIYVADETLRVQRFDANGKFLNLWNIKGAKNERINKLAVESNGDVDVLIGGEIVVFKGETGERQRVLTDSRRHFIDDFVLLDDGGLMYVADSGGREEFVQTKGKTIVNRFAEIHSRAADTRILPAGIKIAVSGTGDIFSVYAVMSLEGTSEYNDEDLMTFHFAPDGKFINKFAANLMPEAILTDNQSRVYVLDSNQIVIYSSLGESAGVKVTNFANAFALDDQNNIYTVAGNVVRKLKPDIF